MRFKFFILILFFLLTTPCSVSALMTSTNYSIFADDFHSGIVGTSTNYRLENTTGESSVGSTTGTTYTILGGYQVMDISSLSLSISDANLNLGDLSASSVSSDSSTITVNSEGTGYILAIYNVSWSGTALANVSGTSVDAGSEEYGFAITGGDVSSSLLSKDNIVQATILMSSSTAVTNSTGVITFKASISGSTSSGSRSQTVTLTLSSNL